MRDIVNLFHFVVVRNGKQFSIISDLIQLKLNLNIWHIVFRIVATSVAKVISSSIDGIIIIYRYANTQHSSDADIAAGRKPYKCLSFNTEYTIEIFVFPIQTSMARAAALPFIRVLDIQP